MLYIGSDSLVAGNSLTSHFDDIFVLGTLSSDFFNRIDRDSISFSHVKREGNIPVHLLVRVALDFYVHLEWSRHISHDVASAILLYLNRI